VTAVILGAVVGVLAGLAAEVLVRRLPPLSPDRATQGAWLAELRRPPVLEVAGALLGAACGARFGLSGALAPALLLTALLLPISVIDLEHRIIPNRLVLPGTVAGLVLGIAVAPDRAVELVAGAVLGFLLLLAMALAYPAGMGLGDVKLVLMLGAFLGWSVFPAIFAGFLLASVPSLLILLLRGRAGRKVGIPFGPFLAAGGVIGLFWGAELIDFYVGGL
jgi:leader peptidase (prepilin peptidase)/N-methyltransferase